MSEINVLVSGNVTPKIKSGVTPSEGNSADNSAAMEFAAIFGGWMAQALGQGQNSGLQSSDPAGKEANSGQTGIQGLEGMLGSLRTTAGLNLGTVKGQNQQVNENLVKAAGEEINTLLTQDNLSGDVTDSGIGSGQLQGGESPLSELDKYKVLIAGLLEDMSGKISEVSSKPADIQGLLSQLGKEISNSSGEKLNVQDVIGFIKNNLSAKNEVLPLAEQGDLKDNPNSAQAILKALITDPQKELNISQSILENAVKGGLDTKSGEQATNKAQTENPIILAEQQNISNDQTKKTERSSQIMANQNDDSIQRAVAGSDSDNGNNAARTIPFSNSLNQHLNMKQNNQINRQDSFQFDEPLPENPLSQIKLPNESVQGESGKAKNAWMGNENISSTKEFATEDGTNPILGNLNISNLIDATTKVDNKVEASPKLPIWSQVSQEIQAKVLHQTPTVRELNIQLHPAELGQINISLSWDNGRVNMHMLASEASTGQILQTNFPELRESLSQSGIQCGMMQMGFAGSNQNFNQGRNQTFNLLNQDRDKGQSDDPALFDEAISAGYEINGSGVGEILANRINVTA